MQNCIVSVQSDRNQYKRHDCDREKGKERAADSWTLRFVLMDLESFRFDFKDGFVNGMFCFIFTIV